MLQHEVGKVPALPACSGCQQISEAPSWRLARWLEDIHFCLHSFTCYFLLCWLDFTYY
jgi:hypothetical protein